MEAAHQLITSNLRFVVKVSLEYRGYGIKLLDMIQEGKMGLMVVLKKFDPTRGTGLSSMPSGSPPVPPMPWRTTPMRRLKYLWLLLIRSGGELIPRLGSWENVIV